MISWLIRRQVRRLHEVRELDPVPGELRGWSWDKPPVKPRAYLGLGVSEIAYSSQCGFRDLWLRRRKGVKAEVNEHMRVGYMVHEIFHRAARDLRFMVFSNDRWAVVRRLYDRAWLRVRRAEWSREVGRFMLTRLPEVLTWYEG